MDWKIVKQPYFLSLGRQQLLSYPSALQLGHFKHTACFLVEFLLSQSFD